MLENYTRRTRSGHGMSDTSQGPGWWLASDGKWYPPDLWTGPPNSGLPDSGPAGAAMAQPVMATYPERAPAYGAAGRVPPGQTGNGAGRPSEGHGYAPYAYGPSAPYGQLVPRRTNSLAIASLICSCAGVFFLPAILGVVFGLVARSQITRSSGMQKGDGFAIAGIIVGFGWLALLVLGIALGAGNHNNGVVGPFT
jgi:hypothetical protein